MSAVIRTSDELRRYAATGVRKLIGEDELRDRFSAVLDRAPMGLISGYAFVSMPAGPPAWLETGVECVADEAVTLFATPGTPPPSTDGLQALPELRLWHRVGADGEAVCGTRSSHTFVPVRSARLFLAAGVVDVEAMMADSPLETGEFVAPPLERCVLVIRWADDPHAGLKALCAEAGADADVGALLDSELARYESTIELPSGWEYPAYGGPQEQFAGDTRRTERPIIGCYTRAAAAVLRKDAPLPLLPGTKLRWAWRIQQLPSRVREDSVATHDYLSIALEFDNGRDLSYYWSAELPVDTGYQCPLPGWGHRETHVVIRCGMEGLGEWHNEERDVYADYSRHVGEPPSRIIRVWLLAVTPFQPSEGQCDYAGIELDNGSSLLRVN